MKIFELSNIHLGYQNHTILKDVSLSVSIGEFIGIIGSNGSGKTTLLHTLLKLKRPMAGTFKIYNHPQNRQYKIGYVPQRGSLPSDFPVTVMDIVLMATYHNSSLFPFQKKIYVEKALKTLEYLNCLEFKGKPFNLLSGGQQQRVLIARAFINDPDVLIVDEPTDGLDIVRKSQMMDLLKSIHDEKKVTIIIVSHELELVLNYVKKLYLIHNKILTQIDPDEKKLIDKIKQIY